MAGLAQLAFHKRSMVEIFRKLGWVGNHSVEFVEVVAHSLVVAVVTGGFLSMNAIVPAHDGIVMDVAVQTKLGIFPRIFVNLISRENAKETAYNQGRQESEKPISYRF